MARRVFGLILLVLIGLLSVQLYRLFFQHRGVDISLSETEEELAALNTENEKLKADISYFGNAENLAKEAKSKFDYKRPGEKMMIIVPQR